MRTSLAFRLAIDPRSVGVARNTCRAVLEQMRVEEECIQEVALALTEACANVVEHARDAGDSFEVRIDVLGLWCRLEVTDHGRGFDATALPGEAPPTATSGRGVTLMQRLADELLLSSGEGAGTRVLLRKRLRVEPDSVLAEPVGATNS